MTPRATAPPIEIRSESDQDAIGDLRLQRMAVELVECVGSDADSEKERSERNEETRRFEVRGETCPDRDIREMPEGVRRMEERHVIAPAARRERVESRTGLGLHARRPQIT